MRTKTVFPLLAVVALPVISILTLGQPSRATDQAAAGGDYVGSDTCITCHDEPGNRFKGTVMGRVFFAQPRTADEKLGCEACHGPGKAHVEAGGGRETIPRSFAKDANETAEHKNSACLTCHQKGNRMFWEGSPHESRGMACVDCHQVMTPKRVLLSSENRYNAPLGEVRSLRHEQPELCLQCHQMRRAQLQRSSHMPFREGKVTCTSCHNPHGTPNPKQLIRSTLNETCYGCHAERRGPFLWTHPPVLENCGNCHEPHGSINPQLLKVRLPKLCQQCHDDGQHRSTIYANVLPAAGNGTPAGYSNRVVNRGCANCHSRIHGSNHPSGNYFTR
ncbi:MAG TPA: DmsE family decaheme c-type cytochrome [Blastocatellia bacterium]|nr:DmsE family decaheme c-type cytochrome [Blastocatellia bacterium]